MYAKQYLIEPKSSGTGCIELKNGWNSCKTMIVQNLILASTMVDATKMLAIGAFSYHYNFLWVVYS